MTHNLKFLAIGIASILLASSITGCGMTEIKEREDVLSQQQQELKKERQRLNEEQQSLKHDKQVFENKQRQLESERTRLNVLNASIDHESSRLEELRKSLAAQNRRGNKNQATGTSLIHLGNRENAYINPPGLRLIARIDTGAKISSLNTQDMTEFERDGKPFVRFNIIDPNGGKKVEITRSVKDHAKIKDQEGETASRPIVKMRVRIGTLDQFIEMSLIDRSDPKSQMLIGRNFLRDFAVVDVSKEFLYKNISPAPTETN